MEKVKLEISKREADTFAWTCPITPDSPTVWSSVAVKRS